MEDRKDRGVDESRRDAVRKMAYAVPVVLTLAASPAFARNGSGCVEESPGDCSPS